MKLSEMRELPVAEAKMRVVELKSDLAKERALVASGTKKENSGKIRSNKKDIARLLTVISEKIRAGEKDVDIEQLIEAKHAKPVKPAALPPKKEGKKGKIAVKAPWQKAEKKKAQDKPAKQAKPAGKKKKEAERK